MLEDAQRRSRRAKKKNPITDASLVVIATNAMLGSEQFPRTNDDDDWEELDPAQQKWEAWKKLYKKEALRAKTKDQAAEGGGQFGGAHAAVGNKIASDAEATGSSVRNTLGNQAVMDEIAGYFDNLAAATTTERAVLEELVKANATLTSTNEELVGVVKRLTGENKSFQQEVNEFRRRLGNDAAGGVGPLERKPKLCPNCKKVVYHKPDDCFELEKNAAKRPAG